MFGCESFAVDSASALNRSRAEWLARSPAKEKLDRNGAIGGALHGLEDEPHTAAADDFEEFVAGDFRE